MQSLSEFENEMDLSSQRNDRRRRTVMEIDAEVQNLQERVRRLLTNDAFRDKGVLERYAALSSDAALIGNEQYVQGYIRLPFVPKTVIVGPRNGYFYVNSRNHKIYLDDDLTQRCRDGTLVGTGNVCPDWYQ